MQSTTLRRSTLGITLVMTLSLVLSLVLAACNGSSTTATGPSLQAQAESEGTVTWYSTEQVTDLAASVTQFQQLYPKITVKTLRLSNDQIPPRIQTEQQASAVKADVISLSSFQVNALKLAGYLQTYKSPQASAFPSGSVDPDGDWAPLYVNTTVIAWNTQKLHADGLTAPTGLQDLTAPAWKGKFDLSTDAYDWYQGLVQKMGSDQANTLMQQIAANKPLLVSGHTLAVQDVENGTVDATVTGYGYFAAREKAAGKPIDFLNPNPLLSAINPVAIVKNAPHPNAAKFLEDWLISQAGQAFLTMQSGHASLRPDVTNNPAVWSPSQYPYVIVNTALSSDQYNSLVRSYKQLLGIPTT